MVFQTESADCNDARDRARLSASFGERGDEAGEIIRYRQAVADEEQTQRLLDVSRRRVWLRARRNEQSSDECRQPHSLLGRRAIESLGDVV